MNRNVFIVLCSILRSDVFISSTTTSTTIDKYIINALKKRKIKVPIVSENRWDKMNNSYTEKNIFIVTTHQYSPNQKHKHYLCCQPLTDILELVNVPLILPIEFYISYSLFSLFWHSSSFRLNDFTLSQLTFVNIFYNDKKFRCFNSTNFSFFISFLKYQCIDYLSKKCHKN